MASFAAPELLLCAALPKGELDEAPDKPVAMAELIPDVLLAAELAAVDPAGPKPTEVVASCSYRD